MENTSNKNQSTKFYRFEKNNNVFKIKSKETSLDIEIKIEVTDDQDIHFLENIVFEEDEIERDKNNLYEDHIVKEELVIGPEEIHDFHLNTNEIHNNTEENAKKTTKEIINDSTSSVNHDIIKDVTKNYNCSKCNLAFKTNRSLLIHTKEMHRMKLCKFCNKDFTTTWNRNRHQDFFCKKNKNVVKLNNQKLKYGEYKDPVICDYCQKIYTHKSSLRTHILTTHLKINKAYKCGICEKKYTKKHNLTCHVNSTHLKVKQYSCKYCKKSFSWRFGLAYHEKIKHKRVVSTK